MQMKVDGRVNRVESCFYLTSRRFLSHYVDGHEIVIASRPSISDAGSHFSAGIDQFTSDGIDTIFENGLLIADGFAAGSARIWRGNSRRGSPPGR